jgi:hypothetical protein
MKDPVAVVMRAVGVLFDAARSKGKNFVSMHARRKALMHSFSLCSLSTYMKSLFIHTGKETFRPLACCARTMSFISSNVLLIHLVSPKSTNALMKHEKGKLKQQMRCPWFIQANIFLTLTHFSIILFQGWHFY